MNGTLLRFYVHESTKRGHIALHEWLLEKAKAMGVRGGTAFRAIAAFGHHGIMRQEHFFELAADLTIEVEFVVSDEEADALIDLLRQENIDVFYARIPAQFGTTTGNR